jgi:hypothetical protein
MSVVHERRGRRHPGDTPTHPLEDPMSRHRFAPAVLATMVAGVMTAAGAWAVAGPSRPSVSPAPATAGPTARSGDDHPNTEVENEHVAEMENEVNEHAARVDDRGNDASAGPRTTTTQADRDDDATEVENEHQAEMEHENETEAEHQGEVEAGDDHGGTTDSLPATTTTSTSSGRDGSDNSGPGSSSGSGSSGSGRDGSGHGGHDGSDG